MLPDKPLLSILVPAYNAERYIRQALTSLLKQTYPHIEILVCDDGSTDKTIEIIDSIVDARIKLFRNDKNRGKNYTANYLLEKSGGQYISVHDADDVSLPIRFEKQMAFLVNHPEYALCGTNFIGFLDNGKIINKSNLELNSDQIRSKIKSSSQFHGPTIVFRKDILTEVGGFYRYFTRAEDIDFTMRVAEKFETANLKEHLYLYRHVPSSLTNEVNGFDMQRLGHAKLLYYLQRERKNHNGIDSLMKGDYERIKLLEREFVEEYENDPTIALRRGVFRLLDMRMYGNAVKLSLTALKRDYKLLNLKCVVYACLKAISGQWQLLLTEKVDLSFLYDGTKG